MNTYYVHAPCAQVRSIFRPDDRNIDTNNQASSQWASYLYYRVWVYAGYMLQSDNLLRERALCTGARRFCFSHK